MSTLLNHIARDCLATFVVAAAVLLAGCGGGESSGTPAAPPPPPPPAGTLDTTFGTGGNAVTQIVSHHAYGDSVAVQSDGKIVVAGYAIDPTSLESVLLARYGPNGVLDPTFGTAGEVLTQFGTGNARSNGMVVQADGKIVVVASGVPFCGLIRYLGTGALDPAFGTNGIVPFSSGYCGRIALQTDGKLVAAGGAQIHRFNPDGTPDASFGNAGTANPGLGASITECCDVALAADGRIVVAGTESTGGFFPVGSYIIRRLNPDGTFDTTCCTDLIGGLADTHSSVRLATQGDGKILFTINGHEPEVHQLLENGLVDTSFGQAGVAKGGSTGAVRAIALQTNGKILLVGEGNTTLDVTRFNANGTLDTGFGVGGVASTQYATSSHGFGVAIQPDGRIVATGYAYIPPIVLITARFFGDAAP